SHGCARPRRADRLACRMAPGGRCGPAPPLRAALRPAQRLALPETQCAGRARQHRRARARRPPGNVRRRRAARPARRVGALAHRGTRRLTELQHLRETERWIANVRAGGVLFAVLQVVLSTGYPPGYKRDAWLVTLVFGLGAAVLFVLSRRDLSTRRQLALSPAALGFDTAILSA